MSSENGYGGNVMVYQYRCLQEHRITVEAPEEFKPRQIATLAECPLCGLEAELIGSGEGVPGISEEELFTTI